MKMKMNKLIIYVLLLISLFSFEQSLAADGDSGNRDKQVWEKIFSVISENTNSDPYAWFKNQTGVGPILRKGNRLVLGHDYFLFIEYPQKDKPLVYLENDKLREKRIPLKSQELYIFGDAGIVKSMAEGYFVLAYDSEYIFLINMAENTVSRASLYK